MVRPIQKHLVVARHNEDIEWTEHVPDDWNVMVIQKGEDLENLGREPSSFLYAILKLYSNLQDDDLVACVQGNPLDHCPGIIEELMNGTTSVRPLGSEIFVCGGDGNPQHKGLPVAECYERWLGEPFPRRIQFTRGSQFMVTGREIKQRQPEFYKELFIQANEDEKIPYVLERLFPKIFETNKQATLN